MMALAALARPAVPQGHRLPSSLAPSSLDSSVQTVPGPQPRSVRPDRDDGRVLFAELAATSAAVSAVSGRRAKVELLATTLRGLAAGGDEREIEAGAAYLAGEMRQRQIGVGWAG